MYRALDPGRIIETLVQLEARIAERFPNAGLVGVCAELTALAREARQRAERIAAPYYGLRLLSGMVVVAGVLVLLFLATLVTTLANETTKELFTMVQGIDAAVNLLIIIGAAEIGRAHV